MTDPGKLAYECTNRYLQFTVCLVLFLFAGSANSLADQTEHPGVLFLHFGHKEARYAILVKTEFEKVLRSSLAYPLDLYVDSVDELEEGGKETKGHEEALVHVLRERYSRSNIRMIVVTGNEAIAFVKERGREICPEASVLFLAQAFGTMPAVPALLDGTGVILHFDAKPTLELALGQNPGTKHVFVVAGTAPDEQTAIASVRHEALKYGERLDFRYLTGLTYSDTLARLAKLPPHSIVLFLTFSRDAAGERFLGAHVARFFSQAATAPTYSVYSSTLGYGVVGGQFHDFEGIGRILGKQAAQILSGTRAGDLPVVEGSFLRPMFDWREMQRWHISEEQVPRDSIVINRKEDVWDRYKLWIVSAAAVVLLETSLIVGLVLLRQSERKALAERRRAEKALQAARELSTTIVDSLSSSLAVIDGRGSIVAVNKRWKDFWCENGGSSDAAPLIGTNYLDMCRRSIATSRDADHALGGILAVLVGKRDSFQMEYECSAPDRQRWFIMHVNPLLRPAEGVVIRHVEITSSKKAQLQVQESEQRFRLIADTAPVLIWLSGTDKGCTYFNKAWLDFTGRPLEQELGDGWAQGVHPDDIDHCLRIYNHAFDTRQPFRAEYRLRRFDGKYRSILDNGAPRFLAAGTFAGFTGACVDITALKESEEARSRLSGLLLTAQEQERASIARDLHDHVNQRLALLAIELQMLGQAGVSVKEQKKNVKRLCNLTTEISHDVQSLSHQLHSSQLEHLGLVVALRSLCQEFSRTAGVEVECASRGLPVKIEEDVSLALFRVAQEALRNAGKYSRAKSILVELTGKEEEVSLSIQDSGVGFDPESTVAGLGLISMRERIRLVGGELSVTSAPGQGTKIEASVPVESVTSVLQPVVPVTIGRRRNDAA